LFCSAALGQRLVYQALQPSSFIEGPEVVAWLPSQGVEIALGLAHLPHQINDLGVVHRRAFRFFFVALRRAFSTAFFTAFGFAAAAVMTFGSCTILYGLPLCHWTISAQGVL